MRRLPVLPAVSTNTGVDFELDAIDVESPCQVPWEQMPGDNRVRFCGRCRQNVYNIEALPRAEAVRLIGAREGRLCVRFHRRRDGTVVTADCWARLRAARRRGVVAFCAMLVIVGGVQIVAMLTGLTGLKRLGRRQGEIPAPAVPAVQVDGPLTFPGPGREVRMGDVVAPPAPVEERPLMGKPARHTVGRLRRK